MTQPTVWNDVAIADGAARISAAVDELRPALVAFAQELVRIPSLPGNEAPAHHFVAAKLRGLQLDVAIVESRFDELRAHPAFNDDGLAPDGRINVVARWPRASADGDARSLILNGHLDVVPTGDRSLWADDPFSGTVRDGRLFGRGACDMKCGVTAAVFALEALMRLGRRPRGEVLLQTVSGEESGGVGTLTTIVKGYRADAAIILEPTRLKLCPIQSGALTFRLRVRGRSIHACMKRLGVSAIEKASYLIARLDAFDAVRHRARPNPYYPDPLNIAPISVGTLSGGDWHSTVPHGAVIEGRYGIFVGESVSDAKQAFAAAVQEAAAADPWLREHPPVLEWFEGQFESGQTAAEAPILRQLAACHGAFVDASPELQGVTYGSDLRLFTNHARIPAVLYGPGDVTNAHAVDECIDLDEVVTATKVLALTVATWCA
jgi:acetylornithine deacetylase